MKGERLIPVREIPLTRGYVALVDDEDADLGAQRWHASVGKGGAYAARNLWLGGQRSTQRMHRTIAERMGLRIDGVEVDHVDGDGLNNQRSNLRVATHAQNMCNRGASRNSASGIKGVLWREATKRWRAEIRVDSRKVHLGYFATAEEASLAYNAAAVRLHGEFASPNAITGPGVRAVRP